MWGRFADWFRRQSGGRQTAVVVGSIILVFALIGAISGGGEESTKESADKGSTTQAVQTDTITAAEEPEKPQISVTHGGPYEAHRDQVTLRGTVEPSGVNVRVRGQRAAVQGSRWTKVVTLHKGDNEFSVKATKQGMVSDETTATVTRKQSAAEKAAAREARKQAFIAKAVTIPYNQLDKNPGRYKGTKVKFTGQIFQIQEEGDLGGIMLLAVTHNDVIDIWDDNVWINYDHAIKSAEEDVITVYGVIKGRKSYETQIGGETYVPEVDARYIVD